MTNSELLKYKRLHKLEDYKKSVHGRYYTPEHLVDVLKSLTEDYIDKIDVLFDPASGSGAILDGYKEYNKQLLGADIDEEAVSVCRELGIWAIVDNTLKNVSLNKYSSYINKENPKIGIITNPPYNDSESINKRKTKGLKGKSKENNKIISDIGDGGIIDKEPEYSHRDIGINFLNAIANLEPEFIAVLHPLSYLIKKTNFNGLPSLFKNYSLEKGIIFPSSEFEDVKGTVFPCVAGLYVKEKPKQTYQEILDFKFIEIKNRSAIVFKNIETIDNSKIRKYPPKKNESKISETGLYVFNFRDSNSLLSSGALTDKTDSKHYIVVNYNTIFEYAFLNCYKKLFKVAKGDSLYKYYILGNLSPIFKKTLFSEKIAWASFFYCAMKNKKLKPFQEQLVYKILDIYKPDVEILNLYCKEDIKNLEDILINHIKELKESSLKTTNP